MRGNTSFLISLHKFFNYYGKLRRPVCQRHNISQVEFDIIAFLYHNPDVDTAGDIARLRMLSKSNVSKAVEALIQKGILTREQDKADRRKIHLALTNHNEMLVKDVGGVLPMFYQQAFQGIPEEELHLMKVISQQITKNIDRIGASEAEVNGNGTKGK